MSGGMNDAQVTMLRCVMIGMAGATIVGPDEPPHLCSANYCGGPLPPFLPPHPHLSTRPPHPVVFLAAAGSGPLHQPDKRPHLPLQNTSHITSMSRNSQIYSEALKATANSAASRPAAVPAVSAVAAAVAETKGGRGKRGLRRPPHRRLRFTAR